MRGRPQVGYGHGMARSPRTPLLRAFDRFSGVLDTKEAARRWFNLYVSTLGVRGVVDTCNDGALRWVYRRARDSRALLPLAAAQWTGLQAPNQLLEGIEIGDGRQRLTLLYDDDGRIADRSMNELYPGRLVELTRVIAGASDGFQASVAFVAGLGDEQHGPGRIHYPVRAPGGAAGVWRTGLMACRRALFDGRVDAEARFLVADGVAGTALGVGTTREEALAAYAAEVARAFPEAKHEVQTAADDYDDDGNLIRRGEVPPVPDAPPPVTDAPMVRWQPGEDAPESWRGGPEVDPITGHVVIGHFEFRGPTSDAPPLPRRPECLPHVEIPVDGSPGESPPRGRWTRLLGELGVTRHAVRIEDRDGFTLIGADLLGLVDLKTLHAELDRIEAKDPPYPGRQEFERYVRFRTRRFRWVPATAGRPEGLAWAAGSSGPRFDAGGMDGDQIQAMVYRYRKVPRPKA